MISLAKLEGVLATLPRLTIGLVGDLFLDRYLELLPGVEEPSIETGLEAYQIDRVRNSPGALGTVMNNLAALGVGLLTPVSVIGDDGHGFDLLREVRKLPVDTSQLMCVSDRLTPTYTKPMRTLAGGERVELNRLDCRTRAPLSAATSAELCRRVKHVFHSSDGVIVLDQIDAPEEGVVNDAVRRTLAELCRERPDKLVFVDSRRRLSQFSFGVLKGNRDEVLRGPQAPSDIDAALLGLSQTTGKPAYCTVGDEGILVAQPSGATTRVAGHRVSGPVDIVGAGDSASSGIVCAMLAGAFPVEAAAVGNLVASITVQQLGVTGTATPAQVLARWSEAYGQSAASR